MDALISQLTEAWGDVVTNDQSFDGVPSDWAARRAGYHTSLRDRADGRCLPYYENELDLRAIRQSAWLMLAQVPMAVSLRTGLTNYTISTGFDWQVSHQSPKYELLCERVLKSFVECACWETTLERESFGVEFGSGEFLAEIVLDGPDVSLETLEGDNLTEPHDPVQLEDWLGVSHLPLSWSFGIATKQNRAKPLFYHIVRNEAGTDFDCVKGDRIVHWKRNVPHKAKRGISDLFLPQRYLSRADKVVTNTALGAAIQAAIAYVVEHGPGQTRSAVDDAIGSLKNVVVKSDPLTGEQGVRTKKIVPGQRIDIPNGAKYHASLLGSNSSQIYISVMEALLRVVATIYHFPEHMITGYAGNNNLACHDDQTEVLTADGWKKFADITYSDSLATMNLNTDLLEYQRPSHIHRSWYSGEMYKIKSRDFDMAVTPNHRMIVSQHISVSVGGGKTRRTSNVRPWELQRIDSLTRGLSIVPMAVKEPTEDATYPEFFTLPGVDSRGNGCNGHIRGDRLLPMKPWLQFLGWFVSEGHTTSNGKKWHYPVGLSQNEGADADEIRYVLRQLPQLKFREYLKRKAGSANDCAGVRYNATADHYNWTAPDKGLWTWLREHCGTGSHSKRIPQFVFALPAVCKRWMLDAMIKADGRDLPNGFQLYFSVSPGLIDDVQRLAIECGYIAQIRKPNTNGTLVLSLRRPDMVKRDSARPMARKLDKSFVSTYGYEGEIFCATVNNGTLITRRNGCVAISGNSALVAESPFVQGRLADQAVRGARLKELYRKVLKAFFTSPWAIRRGYDWEEIELGLEITVSPPSIVTRDPVALTQALILQHDKGWVSARTAATELNRDYEAEQEQLAEEREAASGGGIPMGPDGQPVPGALSSLSRLQFKRNTAALDDVRRKYAAGEISRTQAAILLKGLGMPPSDVEELLNDADQGAPGRTALERTIAALESNRRDRWADY